MHLDFERELYEINQKTEELRRLYVLGDKEKERELRKLQREFRKLSKETYSKLEPWERVLVARHPHRPHTMDFINLIFKDFMELHGDRSFGDDKAVVTGFAYFDRMPVAVIGQEKGRTTKEKMERNFGMPHPEGYRKAIRVAKLAESYRMPVITFVDTPGAYPGIGAEERGQSEAIAQSLYTFGYLRVPTISVVIGEGGSGGALALSVANRVLMMQNAIYSVISPEGCAAILWKDQNKVREASRVLKLTAQDLLKLGVIDVLVPEPLGASHWDYQRSARILKCFIRRHLRELLKLKPEELVGQRIRKFEKMGVFVGS
ncbi:MAG: acetyl-CoA carboxylase carboxyltransferase subunit alpha [Aquificaceae bacterium]|nr:acetyl-CoA carboxylase carboxyltransferase subunit alpha [Aquificaceae bacterium]MCX8164862.1 acetyl-CoA carboxylase carboxyltransferase subunit alpha [Aquificaceae bacterium]